ncbi:MAG: pyridoxamine 5'-phosphate oxidase [Planctomycetota bacterium]
MSLNTRRIDYARGELTEAAAGDDPFALFARWLKEAENAGITEPNAMTLATATAAGRPSARLVLLRGFDEHGFVFYTNYNSRKGLELADNGHAALVFYWASLERQVRIEGSAGRVASEESDEYFNSRPVNSRLGAIASEQSAVIEDRAALERQAEEVKRRYEGEPIPRPPHWGGFRVTPDAIEFWQGRPSRLHDRLLFTPGDSGWQQRRLSP